MALATTIRMKFEPVCQIMYPHFHKSMSIRDVMTKKFRCELAQLDSVLYCPHLKYSYTKFGLALSNLQSCLMSDSFPKFQ